MLLAVDHWPDVEEIGVPLGEGRLVSREQLLKTFWQELAPWHFSAVEEEALDLANDLTLVYVPHDQALQV